MRTLNLLTNRSVATSPVNRCSTPRVFYANHWSIASVFPQLPWQRCAQVRSRVQQAKWPRDQTDSSNLDEVYLGWVGPKHRIPRLAPIPVSRPWAACSFARQGRLRKVCQSQRRGYGCVSWGSRWAAWAGESPLVRLSWLIHAAW